jgi:signal transduction histidine kinase
MKTSSEFIFIVSLIITLFMSGISFMTFKRYKDQHLAHISEFWLSLALNVSVFYLFRNSDPRIVALSMLGWVWPLRTICNLLQNVSGAQGIMQRWHYILLGLGAFVSIALGGYNHSFLSTTLPFAAAVAICGLSITFDAYKKTPLEVRSPLHWSTYILMALFFIERLAFPVWGMNYFLYGYTIELLLLTALAGTTLSTYIELIKMTHDQQMDSLMHERNEKILGSSKYSELGMMSAGIAHEINNPLAVIQARTTQLLRIYRNPEKQKDLADGLQQILYTSERINRTIQGVREFVHQDDKGPMIEISLKDLFDDVLAFCGQRMKNHGVNLRLYGLENFTVIGNKIQLEQIVLNLLNNSFDAIEYLPDKWIEVSVHHDQDEEKIHLYFKDSGNGIPKEIASRIMEPFFSTKDIGKGTGLGLALAKGIAEKHGGSLEYMVNEVHTTFVLDLPKNLNDDWQMPIQH